MSTLRADALAGAAAPRRGPATRAAALLRLVRWRNALMSAGGVLLGALWAGGTAPGRATALAILAAVALTAVANAYNDYADRDIDLVAHPHRPLPRGELSPEHALVTAGVAGAVAVAAAALASVGLGALTVAVAVAMVLYSASLKGRGLPGNLTAATLASLPFVYGAWSAGHPERGLGLFALAIPLHFAREVTKDLDDAGADAATRRTIPVAYGAPAARAVVAVALSAFAVGALALLLGRSGPAGALLALPSLGCAAAAAVRVRAGRPGGASLLKAAMLCAMGGALAALALPPGTPS